MAKKVATATWAAGSWNSSLDRAGVRPHCSKPQNIATRCWRNARRNAMTLTETRPGKSAEPPSDLAIASVEAFRLKLPYKKPISFASLTESTSQYVILRIALADGTEGIAESVCRPGHTGEDAVAVAYQLETFFKPLLMGADPLGHLAILAKLEKVRDCRAAKVLIDVALWDLRGKVLGQPVWRLLGGPNPKPVPLTWIAHGDTRDAMVAEAKRMAEERGYRGMKLKAWKRSMEDIEMVAEVRH